MTRLPCVSRVTLAITSLRQRETSDIRILTCGVVIPQVLQENGIAVDKLVRDMHEDDVSDLR